MVITPFFKEGHSFLYVLDNKAVHTAYPPLAQESFFKNEVTLLQELGNRFSTSLIRFLGKFLNCLNHVLLLQKKRAKFRHCYQPSRKVVEMLLISPQKINTTLAKRLTS